MAGETEINTLIAELSPMLNPGEYVFCTVKDIGKISREQTICEFKESEGTTIVIKQKLADQLSLEYQGVFSWITLNVHSSLEAIGLTALISNALTDNRISCNIIAGFYHDHLFIPHNDAGRAIQILNKLRH